MRENQNILNVGQQFDFGFHLPRVHCQGHYDTTQKHHLRCQCVALLLTGNVEVSGLFQQQIQVGEIVGYEQPGIAHEVENVAEHTAVSVDKVVLLQGVQYDGDAAVEELRES